MPLSGNTLHVGDCILDLTEGSENTDKCLFIKDFNEKQHGREERKAKWDAFRGFKSVATIGDKIQTAKDSWCEFSISRSDIVLEDIWLLVLGRCYLHRPEAQQINAHCRFDAPATSFHPLPEYSMRLQQAEIMSKTTPTFTSGWPATDGEMCIQYT